MKKIIENIDIDETIFPINKQCFSPYLFIKKVAILNAPIAPSARAEKKVLKFRKKLLLASGNATIAR
jgi:hypothetical protein